MATDHLSAVNSNALRVACFYVESDQVAVQEFMELIESLGFELKPCPLQPQSQAGPVDQAPQYPVIESAISVLFTSLACLSEKVSSAMCVQTEAMSPQSLMLVQLQRLPEEHPLTNYLTVFPSVSVMGESVVGEAHELLHRQFAKTLLELADRQRQPADGASSLEDPQTQLLPRSLVIRCADKEHVVPMNFRGLATIGRGTSCHICLDSSFVSRLHGCFRSNNGQFSYRDMSSNGTILLYEHEEVLLQEEEVDLPVQGRLRIGDLELGFTILGE